MGKFTLRDEPGVDKTVEEHLHYIVESTTSHMEPISIILRGSFGRGEGSVMLEGGKLSFLSDYEIDVATYSPSYRSLFARLTRRLSAELGLDVGLRWVRPDYLSADRIGPFVVGPSKVTISSYECRYGSKVLFGEDFITPSAAIDPAQIQLESGILLLLNRMAESLIYMNENGATTSDLRSYYWINKTILACEEALLILWKQYHYSYKERGLRFSSLANQQLSFMPDQAETLCEFVARATEFKLRPRIGLYPLPAYETWQQVIPIVDSVFRHLIQQGAGIEIQSYTGYPAQYIRHESNNDKPSSLKSFSFQKMLEVYRSLRVHRFPRSLPLPYHAYQVVYSLVPLIFLSYKSKERPALLGVARDWLKKLGPLDPPFADQDIEWDHLRQKVFWYWKVFCVG